MTNNPIELLISLAVNNARTKENVDDSVKSLKKYYERNPLLLNVDIDRTQALRNLQTFIREASKEQINLGVKFNTDDISKLKTQTSSAKKEFEELDQIAKKAGSSSSKSFNIDLDRVLIQLDNLGRKGVVASSQIAKFQANIEALRNTNDRLSLKEIVKDIFDISSSASHADKVMEGLNQALIKVGQSQQKLTDIRDKFNINPQTNDEYIRLSSTVERLTNDIIRLQTQASQGGSDQIKIAQQMREVEASIAEARREMDLFNKASKGDSDLDRLTRQAKELEERLRATSNVNLGSLDRFRQEVAEIGQSSESSSAKIARLTNLIENLNREARTVRVNTSLEDQIARQVTALEKLEAKIIRIGTIHRSTVDRMEYNRLIEETQRLRANLNQIDDPRTFRQLQSQIRNTTSAVDMLSAGAVTAARASQGLGGALSQALQKFPVWMFSATVFYAPIRGIQDLTEKVIELDTALVSLQRVMDVPEYRFNTIIESMIANVDELSGKTSDYMKLVGDFARTGLDDKQSQEYANVATILQNISELTPDETMNVLTAAMTAFGEETEGVLRIADRLNEIDNNFAITTRDLGLALNKTASSAAVYGVSLDEVLGYTTAIGVATRESGNIIGNSLKTIFARITTNSSAINALKDIGISTTDNAGNVREVSDIIGELAGRWNELTDAQRQNTSVGIAGMNQQNRFNALMQNYSTAVKATETSINSQNSAMTEQQKYAESLEARINRLQNAWYGFADAMGGEILYDGIVVLTSIFKSATEGAGSFISNLGVLAPLFSAIGVALVLLNKNFRNLVISMGLSAQATIAQAGATGFLQRAMYGAVGAVKALNISVAGLMATLGVGAVFFAVGFAIEKLTNVISENIQMQEKMDQQAQANTDALGKNKAQVDELLKSYENMRAMKEYNSNAWTSENEQEYLDVQQRLADLFPALIDHIDSTGQAHLKSAGAIKEAVKATNDLIESGQRAMVSGAEDQFNQMLEGVTGKWYQSISNFVYGSLEARIKQTKQIIEAMQESGQDTAKQEFELMQLEQQVAQSAGEIKAKMFEIADAVNAINKITIDPNIVTALQNFVEGLDLTNLNGKEMAQFAKDFADAQKAIQSAIDSGDKKAYDTAIKQLNELTKRAKNGKEDFKQYKVSYDDFIKSIKKGNPPIADAEGNIEDLTDATQALIDTNYEYTNSTEAMAGVTQKQIDDTSDLLDQYRMLTHQMGGYTEEEIRNLQNKKFLSGEEKVLLDILNKRDTVMQQLLAIYPNLLDADGKAIKLTEEKIKAIEKEQEASKILLKAYELMRDGKLSAEQEMTVASASGTMARIEFLKKEISMLSKYTQANAIAAKIAGAMSGIAGLGLTAQQLAAQQALESYRSELDGLEASLDSSLGQIKNFSTAIENSSKSSSKANKETEKSIYLTDEYKRKIEELTLAIERQKAIQDSEQEGSNKRRLALAEQIKLEKQRLQVMKDQEASLKKQLATGKIQQTGNVKASEVQTVKGGQKIGGAFDSRISSTFGSRADNHRGVDFAAPKGTAINSPVAGKVIAAGDAKSQGWHWSYGNLVVVQDTSGIKHIMAHMDKVMAKVGDQIVAGIQVGTVGSTGNSTGNHLHYEQNKDGKVLNPNATVDAIRSGRLTTQGGSSTVGIQTGAEAIDQTRSQLNQLEQDMIAREQSIKELEARMINEILANYENRKVVLDRTIQNSENNAKKLAQSSEAYRFELDKQGKALLDKRKINQEELTYLQNVIAKYQLTGKATAELTDRVHQLKQENAQIEFAINDNYLAKIESLNALLTETAEKYEKLRTAQDRTIEYQTVQMKELDSTSKEYLKALDNINKSMREKQAANRKELQDITALINNGKYYGEALTNAKNRVQELQTQIKQLQIDIQEGNFEILITIKNQSDEVVDNIQFEMSRLEEIRKMYEQGSGDYLKYTNDLIEQQKKLAQQHLNTRDALMAELKQQDITKDRIKEIKELLEDEHLAYLQATNAIKDYTKQLEEANKSRLEEIANKVISALKEAYQEMRDEHMKTIDEAIKKETEAHNLRLKQLKDEQDLFRKNVEERLRLIDRQEAERGYNMEIEEMERERSRIQERLFAISMDNSYEAKKERKKLQEELDKIDKDIAEKRHERDIELQKQGLNDLLELKDQEIEGKIEAENEAFDNTIEQINREKAYWEKHYQDLLNDERKFAKIREDIMAGHFDKVEAEMREHIQNLTATMPQLADTMDGTMRAVGTALRQNVIDNLQEAINMMKEFNALSSTISNSFQDNFNPNSPDIGGGSGGGVETSKGNLSNADMKVLMGKFLYDNVAPALTGSAQTSARNTGRQLGQSGYSQGATIDEGLNFGSAMAGLTSAEIEAFKNYLRQNLGMNGGVYDKYIQQFLGGKDSITNTTNRFGVQTPMSYGDMQVMMAKYMRELLISPNTPQAIKNEIQPQANQMAEAGRAAGSKISSDVTYGAVLASLDKAQRAQFKSFLSNQSSIIKNQDLKNKAKNYAASLDTGGMLKFSGQGVDGKGGKFIVAHNGEVVNNPIETAQLLDTVDSSRVMLQHLNSLMSPLKTIIENATNNVNNNGGDEFAFNFYGDFINTNKTMMERLAGSAMTEARAKKGMFNR